MAAAHRTGAEVCCAGDGSAGSRTPVPVPVSGKGVALAL